MDAHQSGTEASEAVRGSFTRSFELYRDLVAGLDERLLASKLPGLRSNTIGAQLWCVVGARESYARAVAAGQWSGFACSLEDPGDPAQVGEALARSEAAVVEVLGVLDDGDADQVRVLVDLVEHEAQHHGQLIRYLYALDLPIPDSWKARYALD